jgi:arsenate reductase
MKRLILPGPFLVPILLLLFGVLASKPLWEQPHDGGTMRPPGTGSHVKRVLFVCIENSNRSQMAEAFARLEGGATVEAYSAGSRPSGRVNPRAVEFMREVGCDLTMHTSKGLDAIPPGQYDAVVTMGCGDACPQVKARRREDWSIPDPKHLPPAEFRDVRDSIREKVRELLRTLARDP